jgi:hypothetical protein
MRSAVKMSLSSVLYWIDYVVLMLLSAQALRCSLTAPSDELGFESGGVAVRANAEHAKKLPSGLLNVRNRGGPPLKLQTDAWWA